MLEGSLRIAGDRLRLSTHLVSVDQGFDLWSETFDPPPAARCLFANSIRPKRGGTPCGTARARGLPRPHAPPVPRLPSGPRGARRSRAGLAVVDAEPAGRAFSEALALDSGYAPAWSGLAEAHVRELEVGLRAPAEAAEAARAAANRALALDSLDPRALLARGAVRMLYDRAWAAAREDLRRAAALEPGRAATEHRLAHLFLAGGRPTARSREPGGHRGQPARRRPAGASRLA